MPERITIGWDVGGAHLKASLLRAGVLHDAAQWPCPLWLGLGHLERAIDAALARWDLPADTAHAVTMTGELVDLFADRRDGVVQIAALLAARLPRPRLFAGALGWVDAADAGSAWASIASANWLATATHAAQALPDGDGVLLDIGSTTSDMVAFRAGRVQAQGHTDAQRLASGELVYHGVVRTPLCALGPRIRWRGAELNVMNELFATSADVYRLTGELDPAHDQHPAADSAAKDERGTQRRLARMIGLDAEAGSGDDWRTFALAWRGRQAAELGSQLRRVCKAQLHGLPRVLVAAGCGAFLAADVVAAAWPDRPPPQRPTLHSYASAVAGVAAGSTARALHDWAQVCAPSVAVAALFERDRG